MVIKTALLPWASRDARGSRSIELLPGTAISKNLQDEVGRPLEEKAFEHETVKEHVLENNAFDDAVLGRKQLEEKTPSETTCSIWQKEQARRLCV